MPLAETEKEMWVKLPREPRIKMSPEEIDAKYSSKEERIVTETNREKLPNFVEALKRPGYMDVRPFYQRRKRWSPERQSLLIESLLMNIPVPPLFLYETRYNTYEVMDGQQRISAIESFYANELELTGLERWPELNGKTILKLPQKIRAGIDRRSISYVVLLTESAENDEEALLLKQLVFERLNTGGVELSQQEVRNCIYQGSFNALLIELSRNPIFRKGWNLPPFSPLENEGPGVDLVDNRFYSSMQDVELVLRFFALRNVQNYQRGMQGFLDLYMIRSRKFTDADIEHLRKDFVDTLTLAHDIFGDLLFHPFDVKEAEWSPNPQRAFFDAVMVGINRLLEHGNALRAKKGEIVQKTRLLFETLPNGTFTGRGNTKKDVQERIELFEKGLRETL